MGRNLGYLPLVILALIGLTTPLTIPNFGKGQLHKDLQEFIDLLPENEIINVVLQYAAEDEQVQQALEYFQSPTFKSLVVDVESIPETQNLMLYLHESGVDIYSMVNVINDLIGIPLLTVPPHLQQYFSENPGITGLLNKIQSLLPLEKLESLYKVKLETSPSFKQFIDRLRSKEFQKIVDLVYENPRFQELLSLAKTAGVDVLKIKELLYNILGITVATPKYYHHLGSSELSKDLLEFVQLIPADKAKQILISYVTEDPQVQKAMEYAYSKEFHDMVESVESLDEYKEFIVYLHNAGLDIYHYIQIIHKALGMDEFVPPAFFNDERKVGEGLKGMINDLKNIVPVKKVKSLYYEKLRTSRAFREFVDHIKSKRFENIIHSLYKHRVFLEMIEKAKKAGLDLNAVGEFLRNVFGLHLPN